MSLVVVGTDAHVSPEVGTIVIGERECGVSPCGLGVIDNLVEVDIVFEETVDAARADLVSEPRSHIKVNNKIKLQRFS